MYLAVQDIVRMQGGLTVVSKRSVLAHLELPLAGLISLEDYKVVLEKLEKLNNETAKLGCTLLAPFMQLQFVTLPSVPKFGITDMGMVDSIRYKLIDPIIEIY